jgi:hypothetical protein
MRAWEHGWVLQHFVDTTPELNGATGKLQFAYLDHLVPRPDGRYLLFFIKTDNHIMNAYLKRFFSSTGTPDAVSRCTVELWSRHAQAARGREPSVHGAGAFCRACEPSDRTLVYRAAERCFGTAAATALSLLPEELDLPDTSARFTRAGLERYRRCQIVVRDAIATYAIIEEYSTPGMNLTWMLNAAWIIPLHAERDQDGQALHAALASVVDRLAQSATGERFLNLPVGLNAQVLGEWGFVCEAALYLYVVTRAGVHRLYHYTAARCGEVEALGLRRERKRALARSASSVPPAERDESNT